MGQVWKVAGSQEETVAQKEFFEYFSKYLTNEPRTAIWVLHVMVDDFREMLSKNEELKKELQYYQGRIDFAEEIFWERDGNKILLDTLVSSDNVSQFFETLTLLAKVYNMVKEVAKEGDGDLSLIKEYLDQISTNLIELLKATIDNAGEIAKRCDNGSGS